MKTIRMWAFIPLLLLGLFGGIWTGKHKDSHISPLPFVTPPPVEDPRLERTLTLLLNSHTEWNHVRGRSLMVLYDEEGHTYPFENTFDIVQKPLKAQITQWDGYHQRQQFEFHLANGEAWLKTADPNDPRQMATQEMRLPAFVLDVDTSQIPTTLKDEDALFVYPHPLDGGIPGYFTSFLFPTWVAQGFTPDRKIRFVREDEFLGRRVYIIEDQIGKEYPTKREFWVDNITGVVLKFSERDVRTNQLLRQFEIQEIKIEISH